MHKSRRYQAKRLRKVLNSVGHGTLNLEDTPDIKKLDYQTNLTGKLSDIEEEPESCNHLATSNQVHFNSSNITRVVLELDFTEEEAKIIIDYWQNEREGSHYSGGD